VHAEDGIRVVSLRDRLDGLVIEPRAELNNVNLLTVGLNV
jgi:hypothetical protein